MAARDPAAADVDQEAARMRRRFRRALLPAVAALVGLVLTAGTALADPASSASTAQVQQLTAQVTGLVQQLQAAEDAVTVAEEISAISLDEYQQRQQAYQDAQDQAATSRTAAQDADRARAAALQQLKAFARSSYIDGSTIPGAASLFTFDGPADLVRRAVLLGRIGAGRADVLARLTALQQKADQADAAAQAALTAAAGLQQQASDALAAARTAERAARSQQTQLDGQEGGLQRQLDQDVALLGRLVGPAQAAAILAAAKAAATAGSGGDPRSLGVLVGNQTIAGPGSAAAAHRAIAAATRVLGTPYAWGGGGAAGPGPGIDLDAGVVGFDCSGLTQYAYAQAGVRIPRNSRAQYADLPKVASTDLKPGDLVFWARNPADPATIHHVAIWLGAGRVLQAPESGDVVQIAPMSWAGYAGAVRPSA